MKSSDFYNPVTINTDVKQPCSITPNLVDLLKSGEILSVKPHIEQCVECQQFISKYDEEVERHNNKTFTLGNFARGLIGMTAIGLFFGMRGVTNAIKSTANK